MARGGKREGSGRKAGVKDKPHILDYWTKSDISAFFAHMKEQYPKSDKIATWIGDQISGKAVQPLAGDSNNPLVVKIVEYAGGNNDTP